MAATTLALGQAAYDLLDELDGAVDGEISQELESLSIRENIRSSVRGAVLDNLSIGADGANFSFNSAEVGKGTIESLNILDRSRNFSFIDSDIDTTPSTTGVDGVDGVFDTSTGLASNANINFLASAETAEVALGGGDNFLNASRDFTNSEVQSLDGADTIRIGGSANGSFFSTGAGEDNLSVAGSSEGLNVSMGDGDDEALFLGTLTPGSESTGVSVDTEINDGVNVINMGRGNDTVEFVGGIQGSDAFQVGALLGTVDSYNSSGYEVQLGAGDDLAEFGSNSVNSGFALNTGTGQDTVVLGGSTQFAQFDLGYGASGDSVVLGAGAELMNSVVQSSNSAGDTLRLAGDVIDTALSLGSGGDAVNVEGVLEFSQGESVWDLAGGDDTLVFGEFSTLSTSGFDGEGLISLGTGADELSLEGSALTFGDVEFDLGLDADVDIVRFESSTGYSGVVISNFGDNDILFIGEGEYGFGYEFLNEFANAAQIEEFQSAGNVIWANPDATTDSLTDDQTPMTLDLTEMNVVNTNVDGAGTVEVAVSTDEGDAYSLITADQQSNLSDAANWGGFESDSSSDTGYIAPKSDESDTDPIA